MTVSILQSNYIPWKGYFDLIAKSDVFVVYDEVQFTKNDWRNRNIILGQNGPQWLTIPVRQESLSQKIHETKCANDNWNSKHLNTIIHSYGKSKGFEDFKDELLSLYESPSQYLSEINVKFIKAICKFLEIDTKIIDSRELELKGDRIERLVDACKKLSADVYLSGPAAKNYLTSDLFDQEKITVEWMDYSNYKEYAQKAENFNHYVSILDLIFSEGKNARGFMKY